MKFSTLIAITGMILDVLGAVVLARSFVLKRPTDVFRDLKSLGVWDFHITAGARDLLLSWLVQAREARTGAILLGIGFLFQALSQLLPPSIVPYGALILVGLVAATFQLFFVLETRFVRVAVMQALPFYDQLQAEAASEDWNQAIPMRRAELQAIHANPRPWLRGPAEVPPLDPSLTSN